jgi:hypothetical protein
MFVNPFKKHDVDEFPGVLQPLEAAPHRASTTSPKQCGSLAPTEKTDKDDKPEEDTLRRPDSSASSGIVNHGMSRETLKAEILADVAANDTDTPYDRKT